MPTIKNPLLRERNAQLFYGCNEAHALTLNAGFPLRTKFTVAERYITQRTKAFTRGVVWDITFPEWLSIWMQSGKWPLRGVGIGSYCMARHNDVGPYKADNVSIQPSEVNSRDGVKASHKASLANGTQQHRLASGRGWTFVQHKPKKPYQVMVSKRYVGCFSSQEEAEIAYQKACICRRNEFALHSAI